MNADQKRLTRELERGEILRILAVWGMSWMTVDMLRHELALQTRHVSAEEMTFHLEYLANGEYVELRRRRDTREGRGDRVSNGDPSEIQLMRLTNRGLNLYDGRIDSDPGVKF